MGLSNSTNQAEKQKRSHLDLLVGCDSTKDDLCKALGWKHPKADPSDHTAIFDQGQCLVLPVKEKKHKTKQ